MATKAERFRAETIVERSIKKRTTLPPPPANARREKPEKKPHNLSVRAGKNAVVAYETSEQRPSRKSTRASAHHLRASNKVERTAQLAQFKPERRSSANRARSQKIRGKS